MSRHGMPVRDRNRMPSISSRRVLSVAERPSFPYAATAAPETSTFGLCPPPTFDSTARVSGEACPTTWCSRSCMRNAQVAALIAVAARTVGAHVAATGDTCPAPHGGTCLPSRGPEATGPDRLHHGKGHHQNVRSAPTRARTPADYRPPHLMSHGGQSPTGATRTCESYLHSAVTLAQGGRPGLHDRLLTTPPA